MKRTVTNGQYGKAKENSLMLPAIVVILGLLVMMYPVVSTAWNNYGASKAAEEYAQLDKDTPEEVKNTQWDNAHEYNEQRTSGPILDPWLNDISPDNPEYAEYLDQLSENDAMARLIFPKIGADLPIYHGTSDDVLQRGLGHLYGSDLPVGGRGTHSVITGHTGLSNATMFDNLSKAEEGDAFYVQVSGHKLKYEIDQIKVVLPDQTEDLGPDESGDYITLITCTPYGVNTHRLLVRGHQVPLDPTDEGVFDQNHTGGWQWWMYALLAAALAIGTGFVWWARRQRKRNNAAASANNSKGLSSGTQKQSDDNY
ncbi:class C sortase [Brevibacterium sp. HMSC22B09]|uniref:class C sortase n=1 Tax=Brevibacterium sp. HMSC22B09 TaxID=1581055 RepID=UPI0008A62853|nr:class C sortase [Brevibacterium sp. HMSC22B09]OFT95818.1 class C sortase [Brevibacterium sp. HMSC22B09]